jgi:hypothetical protein
MLKRQLEKLLVLSYYRKTMTKTETRKPLAEYPEWIAMLEQGYEINQLITKATEDAIAYYDAELDLSIANNPDLKNDIARKATKIKTHNESGEYLELSGKLEASQREERKSLIALEQAKREFAVLKLEMRLAIAQKTVDVD